MKILALTRYDRQGASSRLRTMQYLPALAEAGLETHVESLFDAAYLEQMYTGRRSARTLAVSLLRRVSGMAKAADVIWLEKEALPWVPWMVERLFWPENTPVVTDYDDAIFHRYDCNRHGVVRTLLGRKIDRIMRASSVVVAGNSYLAKRARSAGATQIEIVPTVVDVAHYRSAACHRSDDKLRIGWIGTPETWASFATGFAGWIATTARSETALFRVVGGEPAPRRDGVYEFLPWSEATEISLIKGMDIGLMPLPDTPWTRGKCGYKLIQYMACGLPVIASPVGVNTEIVKHGVNGFLASTEAEWTEALRTLLSDAALRARMGEAGRRKVERDYSLQVWGPRVAQILRDAAYQGRQG
ncbi:MAG: glycosyltransferase family 4 protein [Caldilineaceae bacterium]|nr:glycosyltransferase family 4 protein [Caldilineaceae bacterium]